MSLFDQIAGSLFGGAGGGGAKGAAVIQELATVVDQNGGLSGLIAKFRQSGQGDVAESWVSTSDPNQPVAPDTLHNVLGSDMVQQLAARTGLPIQQLLPIAAQLLPQLVDHMTPNGQVPQGGGGLLQQGLEMLRNRPPAS
jgi:uncharacterized protein YidB (DUF937 family)